MSTPITSNESSSRESMGRRMRRGPRYSFYQGGRSVEDRLAARDGRQARTWHWDIYSDRGCFARAKMVLEELLAIDERPRALMLLGQLTAVFTPLSIDARHAVHHQDLADAREDVTQADVVRTPDWIKTATPAELEAWERGLREQAEASANLADLLRRERESRKESV